MIAAVFSGILTALALPTVLAGFHLPDMGFLAWSGFIPLYLALRQEGINAGRASKLGFIYGLTHYGVALYWIFIALHTYGEVSTVTSFIGVALVVVLETSFAAAGAAVAVWVSRCGFPLIATLPLAWVIQEFARGHFPWGGFSWASIAYSQGSFLPVLQILDLTGIYGLLFLILLSNAVLGEVWVWIRKGRSFPAFLLAGLVILFSLVIGYGKIRIAQVKGDLQGREKIRVSLIQGNIPQEEKWLEEKMEEIIVRHLVMSEEAERENPDLLIWPEASYPAVIPPEIVTVDLLSGLKTPLLTGVVTYEGRIPEEWPPRPDDEGFSLHNSAVLILPGGDIAGQYDKNHLVPLGEYVPFGRVLFFLNRLVPSISSFTPGKELNLLGNGKPQIGVTICYEDLFPEISRTFVKKGADFLVNLTNDAWYEHSSAVFQHFDFSRFRAIENRRAMVRATNTGITGLFSPTGEVIAEAPTFQETALTGEVPIGGPTSFYTRWGDLFGWACVAVLCLLGLLGGKKWSRN